MELPARMKRFSEPDQSTFHQLVAVGGIILIDAKAGLTIGAALANVKRSMSGSVRREATFHASTVN
jgi:hypothetical protein